MACFGKSLGGPLHLPVQVGTGIDHTESRLTHMKLHISRVSSSIFFPTLSFFCVHPPPFTNTARDTETQGIFSPLGSETRQLRKVDVIGSVLGH